MPAAGKPAVRTSLWVKAKARLTRIAAFGTAGYRPEIRRRLLIMNLVAYLVAVSTLAYAVQHIFVDLATWRPIILINLALVAVALAVPFLHRFGEIAGGLTLAVAELAAMFWLTAYLGRSSGVHLQYIVFAAAPFVIFGLERLWLVLAIVVIALFLHVVAWFMFSGDAEIIHLSRSNIDAIYVNAAITSFALVAATVFYAFRLAEKAQAETSALLNNILPSSIVERLSGQQEQTIADNIDKASILFADLQGFVTISKALGPARTVAMLNDLMLRLDAVMDRHGVEKIKTIGDAYMAAAGVPRQREDGATNLVRAAFDMLVAAHEVASAIEVPLPLRIGIATGPVMAGVIGARRLTYDVWGDTVNRAARLEGESAAGRILVCSVTAAEISDQFAIEPHGEIDLKGLGKEQTYFVVPAGQDAKGLHQPATMGAGAT